jgi:hypothetical protein
MQSSTPAQADPARWRSVLMGPAYLCFAGVCVLFTGTIFYSSLKLQLFYGAVRPDPYMSASDWSAPLDDVFIHFDFARSVARGHPFEWSQGNGYSSGGTSLLYPFALAPGFFLGFSGVRIMQFAAVVACTSVFATLLAARRLFRGLPIWTIYVAPPVLLSVGALDWSFFSGMEVAFFLATWALAFVAWDDVVELARAPVAHVADERALPRLHKASLVLGVANAIVVATRPEASVVVAIFGLSAALAVHATFGIRQAWWTLVFASAFAFVVVVLGAVANKVFTGDWSAAGALVKLELNDPRLSAKEVWDAWLFHVRYQIGRVTGYHVGGGLVWGTLLWVLSALPLFFAKTRRVGVVLWAQAVSWVLICGLNGQVRWQNERYTMPAVAWMLLSAAVGIAVACSYDWKERPRARVRQNITRVAIAAVVLLLAVRQGPRFRDQVWFFGRASRNIRDQHVVVGRRIASELPEAHRVLVGDAGAIPYASNLPALDIIGLGGYEGLPFARASRWGVASAIELIEHIAPADRPDVMAIYPSWWGDFPLWFGRELGGVSVRGNVICGGLTKMIYAANWDALDDGHAPATPLEEKEEIVDELDLGDILSEAPHHYAIHGAPGYVGMKLLERPRNADLDPYSDPPRPLWDAGRVLPPGASIEFTMQGFSSGVPARIWIRSAPSQPASVTVRVGEHALPTVALKGTDGWLEVPVSVPKEDVTGALHVTLSADQNEVTLYHLWGSQEH